MFVCVCVHVNSHLSVHEPLHSIVLYRQELQKERHDINHDDEELKMSASSRAVRNVNLPQL
jgi:hypothetical protein